MDGSAFRSFSERALSLGQEMFGQQLTVTLAPGPPPQTLCLTGVLSRVEVDPAALEQFGFRFTRAFSFFIKDLDQCILDRLRLGMVAQDARGNLCKFLRYEQGRLGVLLYFGSVNK